MIVCLCHRISDRDIQRAAQSTCDFEQLQDETCIARNCACCEDCAREIFEDARHKVVRLQVVESVDARQGRRVADGQPGFAAV